MFRLMNSESVARFLYQKTLHNNLMASLVGYDPCSHLSKVFGVSRSFGFGPKGCNFDTSSDCSNSNKFFVKANARPRGISSHRLVDLEQGNSVGGGDNGSLNGSPTTPLCFSDHRFSDKLVVAVDVDEVLGNFVSALNKFIADQYSSNYSVSEYHVYEFCKIWNCSRDEADIRVHEFFKSSHFKSGIHPLPGSQAALQNLSRFFNLAVVTYGFRIELSSTFVGILRAPTNWSCYYMIRSRQNVIKDHTIEWIEKNYPGLFPEIHFGNHFALDGVSRPKSEICRSLNAKILIDDNPRYAIECAEVGMKVLLFDYENSYPWSKSETVDKHPLVTKVKNWNEVEQQLMSLVAS